MINPGATEEPGPVRVHNPNQIDRRAELAAASDEDEHLLPDLRRGIPGHELVLYYQPKIDLATRRCIGVEALVRWRHPDRGLIFPDEFIPLAERAGLIGELTEWVVREAVRQCRAWHDVGLYLSVAVNIAPDSLRDDSLLATFRSALEQHAVSPFSVEVEITETGVMADPHAAIAILSEFDRVGIHTAVDDFGTGFSSLVYLRDLPVHTLKIDKSFVMGMAENDKSRAIIRSTIALGHSLGLRVVAEGVEDDASAAALEEAGCDVGQGYFWSRPLPADTLLEWLAQTEGQRPERKSNVASGSKDEIVKLAMNATSAVYAARTASEVREVVIGFVTSLGGTVVDADAAYDLAAMHLDISCGDGEALLAVATEGTLARHHLEELLPILLQSTRLVADHLPR
ncbi:MAG: EAL domain-containing protein [Acidimicrobiales bacterium]